MCLKIIKNDQSTVLSAMLSVGLPCPCVWTLDSTVDVEDTSDDPGGGEGVASSLVLVSLSSRLGTTFTADEADERFPARGRIRLGTLPRTEEIDATVAARARSILAAQTDDARRFSLSSSSSSTVCGLGVSKEVSIFDLDFSSTWMVFVPRRSKRPPLRSSVLTACKMSLPLGAMR